MKCIIVLTVIMAVLFSFVLSINGQCRKTRMEGTLTVCVVYCPIGQKACECETNYNICEFNLAIDHLKSFVSYETQEQEIRIRTVPGVIFNINDTGIEVPRNPEENDTCNYPDRNMCITPNFVDGKTYRLIITVNGMIPGPTIIVYEDQFISAIVQNNLLSEITGIHWHGMHQINTGFMDGVTSITQCGILPGTFFNYFFKASPSGSFWYHSHTGTQRTDGFFGSLIVKESSNTEGKVYQTLQNFGIANYLDLPSLHTVSIVDWHPVSSLEDFECVASGLSFYPDIPISQVPKKGDYKYISTSTYDSSEASPFVYYSALVNGLGRHTDIPFVNTRLSIFSVVRGNVYRFRLIGAQGVFPFRVSIDNHTLTVVATDGYWIEPIKDVNYIIMESGERYDFLLNATEAEGSNFAFRFETMEANTNGGSVPYSSLGNEVQAILHYNTSGSNEIPSTMYESIINNSIPWNCPQQNNCIAVNCPFKNFHSSYGITCINVGEFRLLLESDASELPDTTPGNCNGSSTANDKCIFFLNFNFERTVSGSVLHSSINGRSQILPPSPPQIQLNEFYRDANICSNISGTCNSYKECLCTHALKLPYNQTIHLVVTNHGRFFAPHPIHMHGHTYFVLYMGYPTYFSENGTIKEPNSDIKCINRNDQIALNSQDCTVPRWSTPTGDPPIIFNITSKTPRKDTLMVPPGGYMVLAIISNNPGWWYMHCHIEPHNVEGMALVLNEAEDYQYRGLSGLDTCGQFTPNISEIMANLEVTRNVNVTLSSSTGSTVSNCIFIITIALIFIIA